MNERVAQRLSRHFIIDCDKISPLATARRGKTWQTISSDSRVNVRASRSHRMKTFFLDTFEPTKSLFLHTIIPIHICYSFKQIKIPLLLLLPSIELLQFKFNFESQQIYLYARIEN